MSRLTSSIRGGFTYEEQCAKRGAEMKPTVSETHSSAAALVDFRVKWRVRARFKLLRGDWTSC